MTPIRTALVTIWPGDDPLTVADAFLRVLHDLDIYAQPVSPCPGSVASFEIALPPSSDETTAHEPPALPPPGASPQRQRVEQKEQR